MWNRAALSINHLFTLACISCLPSPWRQVFFFFFAFFFSNKLFRSEKVSYAALRQIFLKGPLLHYAITVFILEQEQDKPKWRPIYFPPLSPSTPHNEPSREEEFLNNQSVSVQSVCLTECKQRAHADTHLHTHVFARTLGCIMGCDHVECCKPTDW